MDIMSLNGSRTVSDYIDFDRCTNVGLRLIKDKKKSTLGLYIIISINTGLRVSDVLKLKWMDLDNDTIKINERKTGKYREIQINNNIKSVLSKFDKKTEYVFLSQKGSIYSVQHINLMLKKIFKRESKNLNISSHSLRKSFGRRVYENNQESEKSLVYLSELFNHTSLSVTRKYLGIRQEELNDIYMNL